MESISNITQGDPQGRVRETAVFPVISSRWNFSRKRPFFSKNKLLLDASLELRHLLETTPFQPPTLFIELLELTKDKQARLSAWFFEKRFFQKHNSDLILIFESDKIGIYSGGQPKYRENQFGVRLLDG